MSRQTKVRVSVTITIDVDALEAEYGRTFTIAEAQQDVRESVPSVLAQVLYPEHAADQIVVSVREN